jgi:hypothetical protein
MSDRLIDMSDLFPVCEFIRGGVGHRVERGLVRIATVARLEIAHSAR